MSAGMNFFPVSWFVSLSLPQYSLVNRESDTNDTKNRIKHQGRKGNKGEVPETEGHGFIQRKDGQGVNKGKGRRSVNRRGGGLGICIPLPLD